LEYQVRRCGKCQSLDIQNVCGHISSAEEPKCVPIQALCEACTKKDQLDGHKPVPLSTSADHFPAQVLWGDKIVGKELIGKCPVVNVENLSVFDTLDKAQQAAEVAMFVHGWTVGGIQQIGME
jgi:hypothetical protein